jgi:hypothetical protein
MDIKLLTDVEKASIGERQPLPERYLAAAPGAISPSVGR